MYHSTILLTIYWSTIISSTFGITYTPCTLRAGIEEKCNTSLLPNPNLYECGVSGGGRIRGGKETKIDDFSWMALLEYRDNFYNASEFSCGGMLINKRYVLTAAHCVKNKQIPRLKTLVGVRLGEHNIKTDSDCDTDDPDYCTTSPINVGIEEQILHENYSFSYNSNDIALLRLDRDINSTEFVRYICLPTQNKLLLRNFEDEAHTVAGWGDVGNGTSSDVKLTVNLMVKSNTFCSTAYGSVTVINSNQICAGGDGVKDTCVGDSGGPLMREIQGDESKNWYVTGITSYGPRNCGTKGVPGVYTRVTSYVDWILSHMRP